MYFVKFKINPINNSPKKTKSKLPSRRELAIYLDREMKYVGGWYKEKGYNCIEIIMLNFKDINRLSKSEYFFYDQRIHVYYLSRAKMGYCQVVRGGSDVGWSVFQDFENWKGIKSEMNVSHNLKKCELEKDDQTKDDRTKFNIYFKPNKEFEMNAKFSSISDYLKNETNKKDYYNSFTKKHFKFFVNNINSYKPSLLSKSINDVLTLLDETKVSKDKTSKSLVS